MIAAGFEVLWIVLMLMVIMEGEYHILYIFLLPSTPHRSVDQHPSFPDPENKLSVTLLRVGISCRGKTIIRHAGLLPHRDPWRMTCASANTGATLCGYFHSNQGLLSVKHAAFRVR
jgi:hypothetical protein